MSTLTSTQHITIEAPATQEQENILTPDALAFVIALHDTFNERRLELLEYRKTKQTQIDAGQLPDFLPRTQSIREGNWQIAPVASELLDRRVEITGPVERKMLINGLNSGARVYMADFEDSNSPTWSNVLQGQVNLKDAIAGTISYTGDNGKVYRLNSNRAILFVRPRGWHMVEKHIWVEGVQLSASLVDFGLYFFHNALALLDKGSAPYFYLPKIENHYEARLWNDVFKFAQDYLYIPQGTIKATVLIETILAAFEMDEILYELRDHSAGLNCGRWDYIFSYIKKLNTQPGFVLPERSLVTMSVPFMKGYSDLCIQTCHKRGAHAMGGMSAFIPVKNNDMANTIALEKVKSDKLREASNGHDGTWVAHPGLIPIVLEVFDSLMPTPNQIHVKRNDVNVTAKDLLTPAEATISPEGFYNNIDVALQYTESWLRGKGCVPIYNLMEDAATAEISRSQIWQWIHKGDLKLTDGTPITIALFEMQLQQVLHDIKSSLGAQAFAQSEFQQAADVLHAITIKPIFTEFLTTEAYQLIA